MKLSGFVFLIGMIFGGLLVGLLMVGLALPALIQAEEDDGGFGMLTDAIHSLFGNAVNYPLQKVEGEIEDEDIAQFYHGLLEECGLDGHVDDVTDEQTEPLEDETLTPGEKESVGGEE